MSIDWEETILGDEYFDYDGAVYGVETADEGSFKDCLFAWSTDGDFIVTRPLWYHWFTNRCNGANCVCVDICFAECGARAAKCGKSLESSERDVILSDLQAYYDQFSATYQRSRSPEIFALFESGADVHSLKNPGYLSLCSSSSEDAIVPMHEDDSIFIATAGANDVGVINELCMSLGINDVEYIFRVSGPPHIPKFSCTAISNTLGAIGVVTNMPNKKVAKQAAATAWLLNYRSNNMMPSSMIARGAVGDDIPVSVMGGANTPSMPIRAEVHAKVVNGALNDVPDLVPENQAICLHESSIYVPKPLEKVIITPMAKPKPKAFVRTKVVMLPVSDVGFRRARAHGEFNVTRCVTASAYDSDDYSRLYAGSRAQPGFRLQLDTFWSPLTDEYLVQVWVGYNQAIGSTSPTAEGAFKDACKKAVRFCLVQGIPLPEKADVVDWTVPTTDLTGDAQFVQLFDNGATFFPAIVNNSGFDSPHAYMAIPGDHSKLWRGAGDIVKSVVNGKTIFGADVKSDLKITSDYSFLPVSLALGNVTLLPWTSIVMGNSWELAVWLLARTKSVIPILLTGAINANGLSSGAVPLKNELARLSEWRSSDIYGQVRSSIIGPGAIIPAATLDAVKIPIENRNLIIDFRELVLNAMKTQNRPVVVTTVSRKCGAKKNNNNNNNNNRLPPAITKTTKVMTVPKGKQKNTETVQYVKYQQPNMMDMGSQLTSYVRALVDPFSMTSTGVKIPDTVTYPSNTYRLEMRQDITADASGNIAVALVPWHRATLQTSNVTNATNVYDWKSGSVLDYTQKAAIESQFSMARTVAGGIRVRYTGSALGVAGSITGAITDPGQPWPKSYTDVNNLPEFREYSASAESAGVEVIWKPMTIHQQPYHETTSYPTPAGGSTIFYPYGANANVGVVTRSSWQTADGTGVGPITLERNEYPFLIVAGKGFPAGAPFIVEVVLHFEVVQRLGTLQVGRSRPSAALASYSSMDQAANVLAQMPAVRKPDDGFIAKATKIVKGMAGLVRGGFEVVNEVKSGLVNVLN